MTLSPLTFKKASFGQDQRTQLLYDLLFSSSHVLRRNGSRAHLAHTRRTGWQACPWLSDFRTRAQRSQLTNLTGGHKLRPSPRRAGLELAVGSRGWKQSGEEA